MRLLAGLAVVALFTTSARAELTKLGDFALTDIVKKAGFAKVTTPTVLGCAGTLRHIMGGGKVTGIDFSPEKCDRKALEAAIKKEYAGAPITSRDGTMKLWEGKTSSILLETGMSTNVRLLLPGAGAKRTCFADDGFAAFFTTFKDAVTSGNADAVAATFRFPVKDVDDKVRFKTAKALAKKWPKLLDDADKQNLGEASCSFGTESYSLELPDSYLSLEARKVGDRWQWVEMNDRASG